MAQALLTYTVVVFQIMLYYFELKVKFFYQYHKIFLKSNQNRLGDLILLHLYAGDLE